MYIIKERNRDENSNLILSRRSQKDRKANHYKPCPNCKGFFSVLSLRKHYRLCAPKGDKNEKRNMLYKSRILLNDIHHKSNHILRTEVFPVLRSDDITEAIKYDELVIIYGNKLCTKYRSKHHHTKIRSKLRLIGRFVLELKKINSEITDFSSIYQSKHYDSVVEAINRVAKLNNTIVKYASPSTAFSLGISLKSNVNTLIFECIKNGDKDKKSLAEDFLKLMEEDFTISINKTVSEHKRNKEIVLPTQEDIKHLNNYLSSERRKYYKKLLTQGFEFYFGKKVASYTLISMQVFNRRRAGEIERTLIADFKSFQSVN